MYNRIQTLDITSNLDGHWPFDTVSGTTTPDASGNNHPGTLVGNPPSVTGKIGNALSFNGSNQFVSIADNGTFAYSDVITITCWAYSANWSALPTVEVSLISKKASGGWSISLNSYGGIGSIGFTAFIGGNYRTAYTSFASLTSGWHLFGGTYDGSSIKFYVDGLLINSSLVSGLITYGFSGNCFIIAADAGNLCNPDLATYFPGYIDDVRVYHRALTDPDHLALKNFTTCQPPNPNFIVS